MKRFWDKVNKTDYCWLWTASLRNGYGAFKLNGKVVDAHRFSLIMKIGEIPADLMALHKCNNKLCVNPDHLYAGTYSDNAQDSILAGTHHIPEGKRFKKGNSPRTKILHNSLALEIKNCIKTEPSLTPTEIANQFNIAVHIVKDIKRGKAYNN